VNSEQLLIPLNLNEAELTEDMVAAAVYVEAGEPSHAALIIRHNLETRVFHFFGSVLLEIATDVINEARLVFVKELNFIPSFLVPSFLAHCELIEKEASPKYGFFYDPRSFYDAAGKFQNPGTFPEYLTCVGFCLTVIQSYLVNEEFLHYADWDHTSLDIQLERTAYQMLDIKRNNPGLQSEDIMKTVRRILPIEYFSGAYAGKRPVRKSFTDELSIKLKTEIALRIAS
jgi:hypothetical protein